MDLLTPPKVVLFDERFRLCSILISDTRSRYSQSTMQTYFLLMYCFYKSRSWAKSYRWNMCWSSNGISAIGILWVCYILPKKEGMEEEFAHRWIHDELGQSYEWYIFFYFYFFYFFLFFHLNLTRSHNFTILAGVSIVFVGCIKLVWCSDFTLSSSALYREIEEQHT